VAEKCWQTLVTNLLVNVIIGGGRYMDVQQVDARDKITLGLMSLGSFAIAGLSTWTVLEE